MQAAGRAAARAGPGTDQDRRQQDAQNLRFPNQRGLHHEGLGAFDWTTEENRLWFVVSGFFCFLIL